MTDLTGKKIANTYKDLLKINSSVTNEGIDNTLRRVQDGSGNNSSLKLSESAAAFTGNVSVNGNLTVNGSFQPDTVNTNELQATRISATSVTTNHLTAGTLIFQDVSVSSLRTGNLYAANISAGTVSATNINGTNITVDGDRVITSAIAVSTVAILRAQIATTIANTSAALQSNIDVVSVGLSATNTQTQINATQISLAQTSITANASAITVNSDAITSINNILGDGSAYASAGTSATLETRIAGVSSTLEARIAGVSSTLASTSAALTSNINTVSATLSIANVSIAANSSAIAALQALTYASAGTSATLETRINSVSVLAETKASAGTSATLQTKIATLSATMATSINNSNTNITTNAAAITSINGVLGDGSAYASAGTSAALLTKIATLSATMATSINNSNTNITTNAAAITSINGVLGDGSAYASAGTSATLETRINSVSVLAETKASAATSATLETRIAAVSSTMATSIGNSNSAITALSATMATSIGNSNSAITALSATMATSVATRLALAGGTMTGNLVLNADPSVDLQAATKQYVDNLTASSIHIHEAVRVETNGTNLNATYNNGSSGVGATLTNAGTQAALAIDDVTLSTSNRVLVMGQTNQTQNGIYVVTNTGSGSTNWILTRSDDANTSGDGDANSLDEGSYFFVQEGTIGAAHAFVCNTQGTIVFGTTNINFAQFSDSVEYTAGTGINVNASRVISTSGVPTTGQLTTLSATMATSIGNSNTNIAAVSVLTKTNKDAITSINVVIGTGGAYASVGTSATLQTKINAVSATMATSIGNSNTNITTNANAITSINGVLATGAFASAGTSATLQTKINAVSATMATSINNSNTNITTNAAAITSINGVLGTGAFASAGTSATLQTKIATVSATMATSINNSNTNIAAVSVLTKTNKDAITSINAIAYASVGTSATLETRINNVSAAIPTNNNQLTNGAGYVTTDTNTTYTADGNYGMSLSGTAFRLENDRRRNSTTDDVYSGNTHDYTFYDADVGIRWYTAAAEEMRLENDGDLHVDGNIVAYSTTVSDKRLKKNILSIDNALWRVKQLNGCTFTYLKDDRKSAGLIAQDLEKVLPSAVIEDKAVFHGEEGETYKTVQYDQVIGLLVEAVKELTAKVEELENASTK